MVSMNAVVNHALIYHPSRSSGQISCTDLSFKSVVRTDFLIMTVLEMTVLANGGRSLYIKFVHLVGVLSDHYHRRPYRAVRFNGRPGTKENIHKS